MEETLDMADAAEMEEIPDVLPDEKFLIFSILGQYYTLPSRFIGEIAMYETVYPLPLTPDYVLGIINRYSVPYALFDIGLFLLRKPSSQSGKVLVLKSSVDRIAFLIDDVIDITDMPLEKIITVERTAESGDFADAIGASFEWNGHDVFVLDIQRVLSRVTDETAG